MQTRSQTRRMHHLPTKLHLHPHDQEHLLVGIATHIFVLHTGPRTSHPGIGAFCKTRFNPVRILQNSTDITMSSNAQKCVLW